MLYGIIAVAAVFYVLLALIFKLEKQGQNTEQNEQMKQVLNDVHAAAVARDRLDHDPGDGKRVREQFTR
jgi:Na+-translocating ferredoxin:NAD+ oxidoreductase RnfG subunit